MPFDILADLDTPVSAFMKLQPFRPRFLLESVEGGERLARYSFLGFGGGVEASLDGLEFTVAGESSTLEPTRDALLTALRRALEIAPKPGPVPEGVPFQGGLVGALGFGMHHWLEDLGSPFPEPPAARFYAPRSVLAFDHMTRRAALLHDGPEEERQTLRKDIIAALRGGVPSLGPSGRHTPPTPNVSREEFMESVRAAKEYIRAGDVFQVVLSVAFSGACTLHPFAVYRALRLLNPSPYLFYLDFGDTQLVGSSPEALVKVDAGRASLRPIAGTRPRGATADEDRALGEELLADPKENAEHVMLVDLARNDLGRVAQAGSVVVEPYRTLERYSHVIHMVSGVEGSLRDDTDQFDVLAATFPAGTVSGAPKIRATEIIRELEPEPRGFYAGSVGYFGAGGSMDQAITIRTMQFMNGQYRVQAGAGIVADSDPSTEFDEAGSKAAALRAALTIAEEEL